jgi:phospholipase A1
MKKILIFIVACFMSISVLAEQKEYQSPMSSYQDNYFITGDFDEDQVKYQISVKYNLFYPFKSGVFFAYTQRSWWKIYDKSSPFYENNFMPEVFYQFESGNNLFGNYIIPYIDYIQVSPWSHRSNGREDGPDNRGEDKYYGEIQASVGDVYNFGVRAKVFGYYPTLAKENEDINDYHYNYEGGVFFKLKSKNVLYLDKEEIHVKWGGNPTNKGWYSVELTTRILTTYIQPKLFIQYYKGYDEFILYYNKKTEAVRVGLIF